LSVFVEQSCHYRLLLKAFIFSPCLHHQRPSKTSMFRLQKQRPPQRSPGNELSAPKVVALHRGLQANRSLVMTRSEQELNTSRHRGLRRQRRGSQRSLWPQATNLRSLRESNRSSRDCKKFRSQRMKGLRLPLGAHISCLGLSFVRLGRLWGMRYRTRPRYRWITEMRLPPSPLNGDSKCARVSRRVVTRKLRTGSLRAHQGPCHVNSSLLKASMLRHQHWSQPRESEPPERRRCASGIADYLQAIPYLMNQDKPMLGGPAKSPKTS
jgi:hypothetical protein